MAWFDFLRRKTAANVGADAPHRWILVPLGNPGDAYATTRHNLGRLMVQRWMERNGAGPAVIRTFQTGTLYALKEPFLALVPATYMNLSGQVCAEAAQARFDPARMVLFHDDKDLPLGMGRFRLGGSDGGHNGLRSVSEHLDGARPARLRLGIGPYGRPLHDFVLGEWTQDEWASIEAMDGPFARFMDALAACEDLGRMPALVNAASFWH